MFLVKTHVAPSRIDGLGVFASEPIRKGQTVWVFDPAFDRLFTPEQVAAFPEPAQRHILKCGFLDKRKGLYFVGIDYDIFTNHSGEPTLVEGEETPERDRTPVLIAARDIAADEELTQDYYEYDEQDDIDWKFALSNT